MSTLSNELLKGKLVALRIAVPGEPVTQHNGQVHNIDENSITILNTVDGSSDLLVTVYNLEYVVLIQYVEPVEVSVVEANDEDSKKESTKKAK